MSKGTEALRAQLGQYRDAVNELGVEAGVIACHISTSQAARSVAGDELYLEVIREAQLRFKRMSAGYERLRAAAVLVDYCGAIDALEFGDELTACLADDLFCEPGVTCTNADGFEDQLTVGDRYRVTAKGVNGYEIRNDQGQTRYYGGGRLV